MDNKGELVDIQNEATEMQYNWGKMGISDSFPEGVEGEILELPDLVESEGFG